MVEDSTDRGAGVVGGRAGWACERERERERGSRKILVN